MRLDLPGEVPLCTFASRCPDLTADDFLFLSFLSLYHPLTAIPMSIKMDTSIATIDEHDAEHIVRRIDFPAMQDGPLYRLMFPSWQIRQRLNRMRLYNGMPKG